MPACPCLKPLPIEIPLKRFIVKMQYERKIWSFTEIPFGLLGLEKLFLDIEKKGKKMFRSSDVKPNPSRSSQEYSGPRPKTPQSPKSQPRPAPTPKSRGPCLEVPEAGLAHIFKIKGK